MAHLYIVRGLPGSGKSTFAKTALKHCIHFEADMFMIKDGIYKFDPSKLSEAHESCKAMTLKYLNLDWDVVVSNTFTRIWEMQGYFDLGFPYTVVTVEGNYGNVHGVPPEKVEEMRQRWEPYRP